MVLAILVDGTKVKHAITKGKEIQKIFYYRPPQAKTTFHTQKSIKRKMIIQAKQRIRD